MRNFVLIIGGMLLSASTFAASAGSNTSISRSSSSSFGGGSGIKAANNQIGYQSIASNVDYTEIGNGQLGTRTGVLDTEAGPVSGRALYFSAMNDVLFGNDYVKATYDQSNGLTNYIGGALPNGTYGSVVGTSSAILTNYSARYGRGFEMRGASMLTPYLEFGAHKWDRGINFGEAYTNLYYGVGLLGQYSPGSRWVLSIDALAGRTTQSAIVVASGPGLIGFSGVLGNSELYKLGVSADYALTPRFHWNVGLDYTVFTYGISATYPSGASVAWEPDSQTNYITFRLGLGWGF